MSFVFEAATPESGRMEGNQPADFDPINFGSSLGPSAARQCCDFDEWNSSSLQV
jgi:hypothetical protein